MQTGRLFEIIYLLMDRRKMTARELAEALEVSSRTIRRDIEALSAAGVPVYMSRGHGGGVHLLENYVLNKSLISEKEQTEILAALAAMQSTGASDNDEMRERFARIFQREAIDWIDIDLSFWGAPPEYKQAFEIIKQAIVERKLLRFEYYDSAENTTTRTVEPVKLLFKGSSWYLQAYCLKRDDWRIFKLFRMRWTHMRVLDETFTARALPHTSEQASSTQSATPLLLRFSAESEKRVREEFAPESIEPREDGGFDVTLSIPVNQRSCQYLLSFGRTLQVLEPAWVREWVRDESLAMAAQYKE